LAALKPRAARVRFQNARTALDRIVFAQNLSGKSAIDRLEFQNLRKSVLLGLAKCALEETRRLDGALEDIDAYLELEDKSSAVADLESLLKGLNLVGDASGAGARDFDRLLLQLRLDFKQSRFREIIQAGQSLDRSLLVIPEAMKSDYVRILELVGDAYRKLDYIYESNALYARALETGGQDVGLLLKTRKNFERLNDAERLAAVDRDIRALTARDEAAQPAVVLARNAPLVRELILDGGNIRLTAAFEALGPEPFPLVSVVFNGQLVWDRVPDATGLSLTLPSDIGRNSLAISVLGGTVRLSRLGFAPAVGPVTHLP
jgi:tetratricopeptide (TPR) repeat protein